MGFFEDDRIRHKNTIWNKLIESEKTILPKNEEATTNENESPEIDKTKQENNML